MKYLFFILFFLIHSIYSVFSQNVTIDTTFNDSTQIIKKDTLILKALEPIQDSLFILPDEEKFEERDTTVHVADSLNKEIIEISDTIAFKDSILIVQDTLMVKENIDSLYKDYMNELPDSLIFEKPDSVFFVIDRLEKELFADSVFVNDTVARAVSKLIDYRRNLNAYQAIEYLKTALDSNKVFVQTDSMQLSKNDSLLRTLKYVLNTLPEDSLVLRFTNTWDDSLLFSKKENEVDSVHFKIYDNRGEFGLLWIKKVDENLLKLELEEGFYLDRTKQREKVEQRINTDIELPGLRKIKRFNLTIPIWTFEGSADIKFNQGYISESWAEGGESSLSLLSILKYDVNYTYGKKRSFDADFEYRLGYLKAGDNPLQKNDDKLELNFKYGTAAFNNWFYSALLNFKTQILVGKEYVNDSTVNNISKFFSPASVVFSLGLDYKPSPKLTILLSPLTSKFTIVSDTLNYDQTRFGLAADEKIRSELGAYIKAISKIKIRDYITIENKVNFFTNYVNNPQNIDVDWEMNLGIKLSDYIKMSVNTHYIYDDDVDIPVFDKDGNQTGTTKKGQFKELFGVGFTYNF